jgi:N-methylhydantoinase A
LGVASLCAVRLAAMMERHAGSDPAPLALLGVDVGGTFTDAALVAGDRLFTGKVPTTPADQSQGVLSAVAEVLDRAGMEAADVERFAHGMTVGTNALLTEGGARTALVTTEGFEDVIEIARQNRPDLYRLCQGRPAPLVPPDRRFGVRERLSPHGVVHPLDEESLDGVVEALGAAGVEAVAVSLLHSYRDARHERFVAEAVAHALPSVHVSASHDVLAVFREYERTSTAVIDAYLSPLMSRYLDRLADAATTMGLPAPEIMQSSGGLMSATAAARHAAWTVLSGPAGGVVGAAHLGLLAGDRNLLSFDMGGTSCDVAVVDDGRVRLTAERSIAGRALQLPMVDVHTVGAGGGSIGWVDAGGALRVGPQSAGADPGPACYGLGGTEATVTDANLLLGYLADGATLAGGITLDALAARRAVGSLAERAGLGVDEAAAGIVRVADAEMLRALRVVTVERGVDPREHALVAFGGAGPMHAARIADELGVQRVLCPRAAGVLSALGLVVSDRRRDVGRSVLLSGSDLTAERIATETADLVRAALAELPEGQVECSYDLRYRGQAFELAVTASERPDVAALRERFESEHEQRYGYADPEAELELVTVRVAAISPGARPRPSAGAGGRVTRGSRPARFGGEQVDAAVVRGELAPGDEVEGPAVCELPEATVVVPPDWRGEVRPEGTLVLERAADR